MAPTTRSQYNDLHIHEDDIVPFDAPTISPPSDLISENATQSRRPLSNITTEVIENIVLPEQVALDAELKDLKAAFKKAISGGKPKGRGKKKRNGKQQPTPEFQEETQVLDDSLSPLPSPAADEARQLLSASDEETLQPLSDENSTRPSKATRRTRHQLASSQPAVQQVQPMQSPQPHQAEKVLLQEPKFIKEHLQQTKIGPFAAPESQLNSKSSTPSQATASEPEPKSIAMATQTELLLTPVKSTEKMEVPIIRIGELEHTPHTSPKGTPRIEDSVEELDRFEDELEQTLDLVVLANHAASPKQSQPVKSPTPAEKKASTVRRTASTREIRETAASLARKAMHNPDLKVGGSMRVKSTQVRQSIDMKRPKSAMLRTSEKEAIETRSKPEVAIAAPRRSPVKTEVTTSVPKRSPIKRPASLNPPKPLVKSTKPPTVSTFKLPGEEKALELKKAREARLSRSSFSTPAPPPVIVTKARPKSCVLPTFELPGESLSRRKKEAHEALLKKQQEEERKRREFKARPVPSSTAPFTAPRETIASRARHSIAGKPEAKDALKRLSTIGTNRPSIADVSASMANMAVRRSPPKGGRLSMLQTQRTVSQEEAKIQRQRAKEIYKRDSRLTDEFTEEKFRREEAARRARLEAAERGRQASREWAEKQRAKKMMDTARGISVGSSITHKSGSDLA